MKALIFVFFLMISMICTACATVTALHGDKDGFGLGVQADEQFNFRLIDSRIISGDGDGTDVFWRIPKGTDHYTWEFSYSRLDKPIRAAKLEIFHGGAWQGSQLYIDDHFIGCLSGGEGPNRVGTWARMDRFDLPMSALPLLDGDNTLKIKTIWGDNIALDYFELKLIY